MAAVPPICPPLRVAVSVAVRLYREGLAAALSGDRLTLVGAASSRADARVLAHRTRPDVMIVDVDMPEAIDLIQELRADLPGLRLIAFGVDEDVNAIVRCAEAGATGYVPISGGIDDLIRVVERSLDGEVLCSPRIAGELFRRVGDHVHRPRLADPPAPLLTAREHDVLALLRQRLSNKEIALALNISESTVKNHVHHLLEKLQVSGRAEAALCLPERRQHLSDGGSDKATA